MTLIINGKNSICILLDSSQFTSFVYAMNTVCLFLLSHSPAHFVPVPSHITLPSVFVIVTSVKEYEVHQRSVSLYCRISLFNLFSSIFSVS